MFNERIDNEDITLIRGESLSIDVYLTFDSGEPVTHAQIPASKLKSCMWLQNGVRVPLIVTELEEESCYNLTSDIDTNKIEGDSFLVNLGLEEFSDTAPDDIKVSTFNQTFYIVNSATDYDIPLPDPSPSSGGHSVVYQLDGQFYACQNYEEGQIITPIVPEDEEGYTFSGWSGLPEVMPDHCVIATGKMNLIIIYSQGLLYEDIDENTCRVIGRGTCLDEVIAVPPTHEGKTVTMIGVTDRYYERRPDPSVPYIYPFKDDLVIEKLIIPSTVKDIGTRAFDGCTYLKEIVFSERENNEELRISSNAFLECGIEHLIIPNFVTPEWVRYDYDRVAAVGHTIFGHNASLVDVEIEEGFYIRGEESNSDVVCCGYSMFIGCNNLESVSLPSTINCLGGEFFAECTKLGHIVIKGTLFYLGARAFHRCYDNNKKLKITFTGRAPLHYHQDALYSYLHDGVHDVPIEITIEYDGTKAGWTAFRNNNWNLGSATLVWHDVSQD